MDIMGMSSCDSEFSRVQSSSAGFSPKSLCTKIQSQNPIKYLTVRDQSGGMERGEFSAVNR